MYNIWTYKSASFIFYILFFYIHFFFIILKQGLQELQEFSRYIFINTKKALSFDDTSFFLFITIFYLYWLNSQFLWSYFSIWESFVSFKEEKKMSIKIFMSQWRFSNIHYTSRHVFYKYDVKNLGRLIISSTNRLIHINHVLKQST